MLFPIPTPIVSLSRSQRYLSRHCRRPTALGPFIVPLIFLVAPSSCSPPETYFVTAEKEESHRHILNKFSASNSLLIMRSAAVFLVGAVIAMTAQAQEGVVRWDIQKKHRPQDLRKRIRRASGTVQGIVDNAAERGGYFATCKLGTPPQTLDLQLDTGSSDIWVPDTSAKVCQSTTRGAGCDLGTCKLGH